MSIFRVLIFYRSQQLSIDTAAVRGSSLQRGPETGLRRSLDDLDFRAQVRANTTKPLAGITMFADAWKPCSGGPDTLIPPPLPATIGFTQLS
jgi:hypothetical protein